MRIELIILAVLTNCLFAFFWKKSAMHGVPSHVFMMATGGMYLVFGMMYKLFVKVPRPLVAVQGQIKSAVSSETIFLYLTFAAIGGTFFYFVGTKLFQAEEVSRLYPMISAGSILVLTFVGVTLLGESLTWQKVVGIVLAISALVFLQWESLFPKV